MTPSSDGEKSGSCYSKYVYLLDQSLCVSTIFHYQHLLPHADTSITQCWALMPYARQCPAEVPFPPCSGSSWQRHLLDPQTSPSNTADALLTFSSSDILCWAALTHSSFNGTVVVSTPHPSLGTTHLMAFGWNCSMYVDGSDLITEAKAQERQTIAPK